MPKPQPKSSAAPTGQPAAVPPRKRTDAARQHPWEPEQEPAQTSAPEGGGAGTQADMHGGVQAPAAPDAPATPPPAEPAAAQPPAATQEHAPEPAPQRPAAQSSASPTAAPAAPAHRPAETRPDARTGGRASERARGSAPDLEQWGRLVNVEALKYSSARRKSDARHADLVRVIAQARAAGADDTTLEVWLIGAGLTRDDLPPA